MTNIFRRLLELQPPPSVLIGTIVEANPDGTSTVQLSDGTTFVARGSSVAVGQPAYVRNGIVEGVAPDLDPLVIEI